MSPTPQFIVGAEGLDIYPTGPIGNAFPWFQTNASFQGQIITGAGAFQGNGLAFGATATNQSGMEYQIGSTMQILRNLATAGGSGAFGVSLWLEIGTPVVNGATDILLALGPSVAEAEALPILGLTNSTTTGLNLILPSTTANLTTTPHLIAVAPNTYINVGVYFSYQPTGQMVATFCLSGGPLFQDVSVTFATDLFSAGQIINRLKFYSAVTAPWTVDDIIVQAVSSADAIWPAPATLTPELIPQFTPRQITLATVTGNGSLDQMTPSGSEPNWQSATDPTGANSVTASLTNLTDLYEWTTAASDITAVVYRGQSSKASQFSAVQLAAGGTQAVMGFTEAGPGEFVGISENDGTNKWTAASVVAAQFGQISHN